MKNLTHLLALATLILFSACSGDKKEKDEGMKIGQLELSKSKIQPGDEITLKYLSTENKEANFEATMNYIVFDEAYALDIDVEDSSGVMIGKIKVPDSARAISFNFRKDGKFETNNKKGYTLPLHNENGEEIAGARSSIGLYQIYYAGIYDVEVPQDSSLNYMRSDFEKHPEIAEKFDTSYPRFIMNKEIELGTQYVNDRIAYYKNKEELNSKDYAALQSLYRSGKMDARADSIEKLAIAKFPKSELVRSKYQEDFYNAKTPEEKQQVFENYEKNVGIEGAAKDYMLRNLASIAQKAEDYEKFKDYVSKVSKHSTRASIYNEVAWNMAEEGKDLKIAAEFSASAIEEMELSRKNPDKEKPTYYTLKQYDKNVDYNISNYRDTYALIFFKEGNTEEALKQQELAVSEKSSAEINTKYVEYLIANKQLQKAQDKAAGFMRENRATAAMETYLETAYAANENKEDYKVFLNDIKEEARQKTLVALKEEMIDEAAPEFALKDLEGKEIALSSLKGKTVILDFWATWCGPCKSSFPGMQKAVDEYQDNPDVEFFFVDTFENIPEREKTVSEFIKSNNYSFHVLIDTKVNEESREFKTANDYGITGIPTKIIIGPEGRIKFKAVGYDGNNEKMVQEIGLMIDLIQKNSEPKA